MIQQLQTIPPSKINTQKWDDCIQKNKAPIYCTVNYLNAMADNWFGLIWGNYEAVLPICYRKKYFIKYSYTPPFVQQLGFVGSTHAEWNLIEKQIRSIVRIGDMMLNHTNVFAHNCFESKTNFIINLQNDYPTIVSNYTNDLKQNLKKASKEAYIYAASSGVADAIDLYKKHYGEKMKKVRDSDYENFKTVCMQLQANGNCLVRQITDSANEVLAIALLLKDENRIYNLANTTTTAGKKTAANQLLIDSILHEFSNTALTFDFEGSDLVGVKSFYQKFGAVNEPYFHWCLSPFVSRVISILK